MNKTIIGIIILVIVGLIAFYGGIKYEQSRRFSLGNMDNFRGFRGTNPAGLERQGNLIMGKIISMDNESITIEIQDGGSKIVFFSESTEINKIAQGSIQDLQQGIQVFITGKENPDGSYSAETIQIR